METEDRDPEQPGLGWRRAICIALLLVGLLSLRLVHLNADTPVLITLPDDVGLFVDEGYKTMGPRNRVLFGADSWSPADDYTSWRPDSPLTQWSYEFAFRLLAPDLGSARVVTIVYFGLFLAGYVWAMSRRLSWAVFAAGLIALGLESTLYFYSRTAQFEVPMITFLYGLLFCFARLDPRRVVLPFLLTAGFGAILARAIKMSAVFYLVPIGLAVVIHLLVQTRSAVYGRRIRAVVFGITVVSLIVFAARYDWIHDHFIQQNIDQSSHAYSAAAALSRALTMPLLRASPFLVIAGLFCLAHGLATRPEEYFGSLYRLSLIGSMLLVPFIVATFPYSPLRYYVPALPAYLLFALEWYHLQVRREDVPAGIPWPRRVLVIALLAMTAFAAMYGAYRLVSVVLPPRLASRSDVVTSVFIPGALVLGVLAWAMRGTLFRRRVLLAEHVGLALGVALYSGYGLISFLVAPTYQVREVTREVARVVGAKGTIAGDWAPMFVFGTPVRALYVNSRFNPVSKFSVTRPDYFLHGESRESRNSLAELRQQPGVRIGDPIDVGTYYDNRQRITLYPLSYEAPSSP